MTIAPTTIADDDSETLYWLTIARRILSGEIEPQDARRMLTSAAATGKAANARGVTQTMHPSL